MCAKARKFFLPPGSQGSSGGGGDASQGGSGNGGDSSQGGSSSGGDSSQGGSGNGGDSSQGGGENSTPDPVQPEVPQTDPAGGDLAA